MSNVETNTNVLMSEWSKRGNKESGFGIQGIKFQAPNPKQLRNFNHQMSKPILQANSVLVISAFRSLKFVWYLVLGIWNFLCRRDQTSESWPTSFGFFQGNAKRTDLETISNALRIRCCSAVVSPGLWRSWRSDVRCQRPDFRRSETRCQPFGICYLTSHL